MERKLPRGGTKKVSPSGCLSLATIPYDIRQTDIHAFIRRR
ncbi:hypothetical protein [uncultured Bacteroides sp.]|nr:hypothetical protein [uncultured Bacteroides sp.]